MLRSQRGRERRLESRMGRTLRMACLSWNFDLARVSTNRARKHPLSVEGPHFAKPPFLRSNVRVNGNPDIRKTWESRHGVSQGRTGASALFGMVFRESPVELSPTSQVFPQKWQNPRNRPRSAKSLLTRFRGNEARGDRNTSHGLGSLDVHTITGRCSRKCGLGSVRRSSP